MVLKRVRSSGDSGGVKVFLLPVQMQMAAYNITECRGGPSVAACCVTVNTKSFVDPPALDLAIF